MRPRSAPRVEMGDEAARLRAIMRLVLVLAVVGITAAWAASRGWLPSVLGWPALAIGSALALVGAQLGVRARREALQTLERRSGLAMQVALTAALGSQEDAVLDRIATQGGTAGQVARQILRHRRGGGADRRGAPPR